MEDEHGVKYRWTFYRETHRKPAWWWFCDHTGYVRFAGKTWDEAAEKIRLVAENHGFKTNVS